MNKDTVSIGEDFLAHHGVKNQQWGVRNGPPYPLDEEGQAKFDKEVAKQKKRDEKEAKKAEQRRKNILKNPKKIVKYQDEFTTEEINEALKKLDAMKRVKDLLPKKVPKLSHEQKKWAKDANLMLKNFDKFTPEQLRLAMDANDNFGKLKDRKLRSAEMPKKWMNLGIDYVKTLVSAGSTINDIKKLFNGEPTGIKIQSGKDLTPLLSAVKDSTLDASTQAQLRAYINQEIKKGTPIKHSDITSNERKLKRK